MHMKPDQTDLLLNVCRQISEGAPKEPLSEQLADRFGGAAGRVACWTLDRAVRFMSMNARRPFSWGREEPTRDEQALASIIDRLISGEEENARMFALWLTPSNKADKLLNALSPLTTIPALQAH